MLPARSAAILLSIAAAGSACRLFGPAPPPSITWRQCPEGTAPQFQCGSIRVAEARSKSRGRQIEIAFLVSRAPKPIAPAAEPVFLLAGGPGDGSTSLQGAVSRWFTPVRQRDFVLVDQRGTGRSSPLECPLNAADDPASTFGHIFDRDRFTRCRAALAATSDLNAYTTADAADDLDDVRAALGYDRILLWGGSYGSRLAQSYLQRHGDRVAIAVLDGIAPLGMSLTGRFPVHLQESLDALPYLAEPLGRIRERLSAGPVDAMVSDGAGRRVPVKMSLGDVAYAIRGILYGTRGYSELGGLVHAADRTGDFDAFAQHYWTRAVRMDNILAHGLHLSVLCGEDVPLITSADQAAADKTFGGRYFIDEYRAACEIWKVAPVRVPDPDVRHVPALLLSGRFDPATPPSIVNRVTRWLPGAKALVAPRAGHGVTFGCSFGQVGEILRTGVIPSPLPAMCGAGG